MTRRIITSQKDCSGCSVEDRLQGTNVEGAELGDHCRSPLRDPHRTQGSGKQGTEVGMDPLTITAADPLWKCVIPALETLWVLWTLSF